LLSDIFHMEKRRKAHLAIPVYCAARKSFCLENDLMRGEAAQKRICSAGANARAACVVVSCIVTGAAFWRSGREKGRLKAAGRA